MSIEAFWFAALLLVALIVLPDPNRSQHPDEVVPAVIMDLLQGPDYRRDGLRK